MADESDDILAARRDVVDMENMLDGYLNFARGLADENIIEMDVDALVKDLIALMAEPKPSLTIAGNCTAHVREIALRRAMTNILENAVSYGKAVDVCVMRVPAIEDGGSEFIDIIIDDDGPGIAPEDRAEAFRPFTRLDSARGQNVKGVGLGLSIARDAAHAHGGELTLHDSPMGGLRAIFRIPV
jgi:two-component system osmolarity sensor histidine kinase EnvZ